MRKNLVSISYFSLFFLVALVLPITRGDLVDETCKSSPLPKVCTSALRADPKSKTADTSGLALIVVEAIERQSITVLHKIDELIKNSPSLKVPLSKCAGDYKAILKADIPEAKEALQKGNPKFAEGGVIDAGDEARYCEEEFSPSTSPLTDSNNAVRDLSIVGEAIIKLLL